MIPERLCQLIDGWLDATLDDTAFADLEAALAESADARREFWDRAVLHGLLREAIKTAHAPTRDGQAAPQPEPEPAPPRQPATAAPSLAILWRLFDRGRAAAIGILLLGGCGVGSIVTSLAFAYSALGIPAAGIAVLHEEGFELPPPPDQSHLPNEPDLWSGDETEVVPADAGIVPRSGRQMLRFVSGHPRGATYAGGGSEIWRIIDLREARAAAGSRDIQVEFSAFFNGAGGEAEPLRFWLSIIATDAGPDALGDRWGDQFLAADADPATIAAAQTRDAIDDDPLSWERLSAAVTVPAKARYLLLHCAAVLPKPGTSAATVARHYVDDITIAARPVTATAAPGPALQKEPPR